jgi:hypothetical protein
MASISVPLIHLVARLLLIDKTVSFDSKRNKMLRASTFENTQNALSQYIREYPDGSECRMEMEGARVSAAAPGQSNPVMTTIQKATEWYRPLLLILHERTDAFHGLT